MATEPFLVNPPKMLRRKRNPVGEILTTVGSNPHEEGAMRYNPWYGHSRGHRIAALMRWGRVRRGKVRGHVRRVRRLRRGGIGRYVVSRRRRVVRSIDRRTRAYKLARAAQYRQLAGFLALTAPGKKARYVYKSGQGWVRKRRRNPVRRRRIGYMIGNPLKYRGIIRSLGSGHYRYDFVKSVKRRRHGRRKHKRNPMFHFGGISYRRRHHRRHYRRHRRNPELISTLKKFGSEVSDVRSWVPLAITGGLSAATGAVVPGMLGVVNPWVKYGTQTAVAIGGGLLVENFVDKRHGQAWVIAGVAMVGYQLLKQYVLVPYLPQFAVNLGEYQDYYPSNVLDRVSQEVGAFPNEMSAFPNEMSEYPGVGAYPYDGSEGY